MKYNFDEVIDRIHDTYSYSMKWADSKQMAKMMGIDHFPEDRICLQTADMDFKTAPAIIEAMQGVAQHGIYGYSGVNDEYREAVVHWYHHRQNWDFKPEDVTFTPGTHTGIAECIKRLTKPGDGVIVLVPSYSYHFDVEPNGRKYVAVPMVETEGYYTIDFDKLEAAAAKEENTMFIICHPHNPTGRIWTDEELLKMAEISRRNNVIMVSDEVHSDIIRKGKEFHPMMKVVGPEGLISFTAVNKTFNLAGLACTNMIMSDPALKEKFGVYFSLPSPFGIAAVIAAYTKCEDWVDELNAYLDENLNYAINFIKEKMPKAKCLMPEGGYIIWVDLRGYGLSDEEINHKVLDEAHLILQGGQNFDSEFGDQFQRICLPSPKSVIIEAFDRLAKAFEE